MKTKTTRKANENKKNVVIVVKHEKRNNLHIVRDGKIYNCK